MIKCNILKFYLTGPFILFCMFSWHISALGKIYIYFISNNSKDQEAKLRCSIIKLVLISVKYLAYCLHFHIASSGRNTFRPSDQREKHSKFAFESQMGHVAHFFFFNLFFTYILQTLIIIIGILARDYSVGSIIDLIQLKIDTTLLKITVCIYLHQN